MDLCFDRLCYDRLLEGRRILLCGHEGTLSRGLVPILERHGAAVSTVFFREAEPRRLERFTEDLLSASEGADGLVYLGPPLSYTLIPDETPEGLRDLLDRGVTGLHLAVRAVLPSLREKRKGTIVAVGSDHALTAVPGTAPYAAASAGLSAYIRAAAVEWAKYGIRANSVLCGFSAADNGEFYTDVYGEQRAQSAFRRYQPLERAGTVEDIANAVLFLSCDMSDFITGEMLPADGGAMVVGHSQVWHPEGKPPFEFPRKEERP